MARVTCFGDSHTAADFMTGQLRRRLQDRFGDAGHGFIMAGRPWPSYRHRDINNGSSGRWETLRVRHAVASEEEDVRFGPAGVAIETDRPNAGAWLETSQAGPVGHSASRFELYYLARPHGGRIQITLDQELVAQISSTADQIVPAYHLIETSDEPHRLEIESLGHGMVRLFGVTVEREGPGIVVDSLGINGARISAMLSWDDEVFSQTMAHRSPDLIVLWYGANSVGDDWHSLEQYEQWVIDAMTRARRAVPDAACLFIGPPDMARASFAERENAGTPENLHRIIEAQRDAASLVGCGYFDMFQAMGGIDSNLRWSELDPPRSAPDGIHYTAPGYTALADLLYDALIDGYEQYLEGHSEGEISARRPD